MSNSKDLYNSIFYTEEDGLRLIVRYAPDDRAVGAVEFIPDPRFPRYEVFNWSGLTVSVELDEPKAHKLLANVLNDWLALPGSLAEE